MKYHHAEGIVEKDRRSHPKVWLGFFISFIFIAYGGFLTAILSLNGWPLDAIDKTARIIKTTRPNSQSDTLYIPSLNVKAAVGKDTIKQSGDPAKTAVTLTGTKLAPALTPSELRDSSPFFNIGRLKDGDEIFLDSNGTRYIYKIAKKDQEDKNLTLKSDDGKTKLSAKPIGTVTWDGNNPRIKAF